MNESLAKQLIFDCAMKLMYEKEKISREEVANKLLEIARRLDEKTMKQGSVEDGEKRSENNF